MDWLIYGGNGYTGRLIAEEAVRRVRALDDGRMKTYALDEVLRKKSGPR